MQPSKYSRVSDNLADMVTVPSVDYISNCCNANRDSHSTTTGSEITSSATAATNATQCYCYSDRNFHKCKANHRDVGGCKYYVKEPSTNNTRSRDANTTTTTITTTRKHHLGQTSPCASAVSMGRPLPKIHFEMLSSTSPRF